MWHVGGCGVWLEKSTYIVVSFLPCSVNFFGFYRPGLPENSAQVINCHRIRGEYIIYDKGGAGY